MNLSPIKTSYKWNHAAVFCGRLVLVSIVPSRFSRVAPGVITPCRVHPAVSHQVHVARFVYLRSFISGPLGASTFWLLWTNLSSCLCFQPFGYVPRSGLAGSVDNSVFNCWRNCSSIFHSGCLLFRCFGTQAQSMEFSLSTNYFVLFFVFITSVPSVVLYWPFFGSIVQSQLDSKYFRLKIMPFPPHPRYLEYWKVWYVCGWYVFSTVFHPDGDTTGSVARKDAVATSLEWKCLFIVTVVLIL